MAKSIGELEQIHREQDESRLNAATQFFALPNPHEKDVEGIYNRAVTYDQLMRFLRQVISGVPEDTPEGDDHPVVPLDVDNPQKDLEGLNDRCHDFENDNLVAALNKENERAETIEGIDTDTGELPEIEGLDTTSLFTAIQSENARSKESETEERDRAMEVENDLQTQIGTGDGETASGMKHNIYQLQSSDAHQDTVLNNMRGDIGELSNLNVAAANLVAAINALQIEAEEVEHDDTLEGKGITGDPLMLESTLKSKIEAAATAQALADHEAAPDAHGIDIINADIAALQAKTGLDLPALTDDGTAAGTPLPVGEYKLVITASGASWALIENE